MEWAEWNNKQIFMKLKTGDCYTGRVISVDSDSISSGFITIIDKYNDKISIAVSEIVKIVEEGRWSSN